MTKWILFLGIALSATSGCQHQPATGEAKLDHDEKTIRKWYEDWMTATKEGDLALAKSLIADDAIFLVPGAGQMDKQSFAEAATATDPNTEFQLDCEIQEVRIFGDNAWLLSTISLEMTDKKTDSKTVMKGDGLSILERHGDGWAVVRDANTMIAVPAE